MSRLLRNILVVLGLTIALTSAALGLLLANEERAQPVEKPKTAAVMIAARQIQAGHRIEKSDLGWQEVELASVPSGAFAKPGQTEVNVVGTIAMRNLAPGELINQQYLIPAPAEDTLAASLNPGWRAVTFTADASQTAAGMLMPNDRVDLILAIVSPGSAPDAPIQAAEPAKVTTAVSSINVISNIRVLAVNGALRSKADAALVDAKTGGTVTLEVRPEQVSAVLGAASSGRLGLALRSRFDGITPSVPAGAATLVSTLRKDKQRDATAVTVPQRKSAKPEQNAATRSESPGVIIIRGLEKTRAN